MKELALIWPFKGLDIELSGKSFKDVDWPLLQGYSSRTTEV